MFARGTFCALCFIVLFLNINVADWVDMPQFSDESKIYRIPSVQHDHFYKFRRVDVINADSPDYRRNGNQTYRNPVKIAHVLNDKKAEIEKTNTVSTIPSNLSPDRIADDLAEIDKNRTAMSTAMIEDKLINKYDLILKTTKNTTSNTLTTQSPPITTHKQDTRDNYYNYTLKRDDGILQYLPVDILKSVHRTLRSQPVSFEGKFRFLKMFEKTLMSEIESRLTTAMTSNRKVRGVDYGHGYDDHDSYSVGFPSIEGALMAISFLTFAVYLVRLVMLLFRNMNNPMTTTTVPTVFLGKRKRSADFNDETARILNNINNFVPDF